MKLKREGQSPVPFNLIIGKETHEFFFVGPIKFCYLNEDIHIQPLLGFLQYD